MNTPSSTPSRAWELELGSEFHDPVKPAPFPQAILRYRNQEWAEKIGWGDLSEKEWQDSFWAFIPRTEHMPQPLALRYHGHQFLHYNPDLGDGRGFLYAQLQYKNKLLDLGTKGSGQTPWSRRGDGRLTLKGSVREALATSFLEALGVNTSKTFSIFETGEALERGDEPSPTRSAVLTRLSHSHVRIGTFQRLAFLEQTENLQKLLDYCLRHHYPEISQSDDLKIEKFFQAVCTQVAKTTARWMLAGFVHGVLNTDNINITGESFDYGPYRFLTAYDTEFTAAYFDQEGLYAYGQQPRILHWNLQQLQACLEKISTSTPQDFTKGFQSFQDAFYQETMSYFLKRLNLKAPEDSQKTEELFFSMISFLEKSRSPFEPFMFDFFGGAIRSEKALQGRRSSFYKGPLFESFFAKLKSFEVQDHDKLQDAYFQQENPVQLPIDEIERIWSQIDQRDDWSLFEKKISDCQRIKGLYAH